MSAIITTAPILVAATAQPDSNQNTRFIGAQHIVIIGEHIYVGVVESPDGNPPFHFQVYKSTNHGTTWNRMDAAHEPTSGAAPIYVADAASDGVYFVWNDSTVLTGGTLSYARFDPVTDTWGTPVITADNLSSGAYQSIARRSNGDIVVFYQTALDHTLVDFGIFSHAGAWGGDNLFYTGVSISLPAACIAGSDNMIHVLLNDGLGPFDVEYNTLSPANVVSAPASIASLVDQMEAGLPQIWNNRLIFPYGDTGAVNDAMFVGTPANAPVWTNPLLPLSATHGQWPIAFVTSANRLLIFQTLVGAGDNPLQLWYTPFDGSSFGTAVLYYDALANPPATSVRDLLIVSLATIPAIGIVGIVAMQPDNGLFPPENTYFLREQKRCLQ
jgi:hypothetical protein